MNNNRLSFPNGFEKTNVRWEKIKIKLAHNGRVLGEVALWVGFERWEAILPSTCYMPPFFVDNFLFEIVCKIKMQLLSLTQH